MDFTLHNVQWTDDKTDRFWNVVYEHFVTDNTFANAAARGLLRVTRHVIPPEGRVLDYGTGKGHLIEVLLKCFRGAIEIYGCDCSQQSCQSVNHAFGHDKRFKTCYVSSCRQSPLLSGFFDVVFLTEVIEHLGEEQLRDTMREIRRLIKHGGVIILTCPNNEDIQAKSVLCPDCGAMFHPVQHVRRFNCFDLERTMKDFAYTAISCKPYYLAYHTRKSMKTIIRNIYYSVLKKDKPNLVYIGRAI